MRIAISTLIVRSGLSGSNESYLVNLLAGLQAVDQENEYLLFVTPQNAPLFAVPNPRFRLIHVPRWGSRRAGRIALDQLAIPSWAKRLGAAVLHYPGTLGSAVGLRRPKQVVTVHYDIDPAHAPSVTRLKRAYYATFMRRSRETASAIVVPSHAFGRDFAARWAMPVGKVHVVYHGVRADPGPQGHVQEGGRLLKELGLAPGYLLSITNALPHKNVPCLLEAYAMLALRKEHPVPLVLAGDIPRGALQGWGQQLSARGVHVPLDRVILTGVLPYEKVALLYQHAGLMVTATLTESFSMPVLEAMINRCPVVASDLPVHREIGGQALILVTPREARGFAEACSHVLADPVQRRAMVERGVQRAAQFSWERTARDTMAVYRSVV